MTAGKAQHIIIGPDGAAFAAARAARERGEEALVLVPRGLPSVSIVPPDIRALDLDPRDGQALPRHLKDAACVYYCAGTATLPIDEDEPVRLAAIVDAVAKAKTRLVYVDAPFAYGQTGRALSEDAPQRARDPLGAFLAALAQFVLSAHRARRIDAVIARHGDLFGPQVVRSPFGEAFIEAVLDGRDVTVLGRARASRSVTYAPDLGRALILLGEMRDSSGQIWHLPSSLISPEKFIGVIRHAADLPEMPKGTALELRSARMLFGPWFGGKQKAQQSLARLYESEFTLLSAKFERAFGLHATHVKEALKETVETVRRGRP